MKWVQQLAQPMFERLLRNVLGPLLNKGFTASIEMDRGEVRRVIVEPIKSKGETGK